MHRRDGTELGLVLAVLYKSDIAKDIFKTLPKVSAIETSLLWLEKTSKAAVDVARSIPPPRVPKAKQKAILAGPFGEDVLTIISVLRVVKRPEFAQLAAYFKKARSRKYRLMVNLSHQDVLKRLEKI
ncbi:hypothetical protein EVAR_5200_1 [Eumeta japonica]|uniref:Uncharacterized protein n=1 Tax=Eumeta variegata TaxID=151549 RepID=A0A4C1V4P5_EUMVA|nr:hypothetical protein EVAR_5200_1 [Eumeta japonica]